MSKKKELNRAEKVRRRRGRIREQEIKDKPVLKPVSAIRPSEETSFIGTKKRKVKTQRYEATALAPTNEALRPRANKENARTLSMPELRIEWRAVSAALIIFLGVGLYLLFTSPYFMVAPPKIRGNQHLPSEEIANALALDGQNIFSIVPEKLERDLLLKHPGLAGVEITLSLPNVASVSVQERQPALIWQQDGKAAWVDLEGVAFRATSHVEGLITVSALGSPPAPAVDISTLNELAPPPFIEPKTVLALQALVAHVPAGTVIVYDPKSGLGWIDSRGWTVELGDITEEIGLKLRLYERMLGWFEHNNVRPILVNLEYPHAPYYRTEPK
ncbi:MAG: FtsQ-type POTRA domain-containing protein [Chloroflexi bacterium]|nr:FtsQ-type POTRA domain-containing protein [Chloroflexota bacterium]